MNGVFKRDRVRRIIVEPMLERWSKPRHVTSIDAVISDYIEDLSAFSEDILGHAFTEVRRNHPYAGWPSSSQFYQAAQKLTDHHLQNNPADNSLISARDRTIQAHKVAARYMDQSVLGQQSWREGWFSVLRKYVVTETARQLVKGISEPEISVPGDLVEMWRQPWLSDKTAKGRS